MSKPIAFGVCGLGRIGAQHCRMFAQNRDQYRPVAFCDSEFSRAQALAAELGGRPYARLDDFLADADLELAILATRSPDHASHAAQTLAAGKTVLLEKPIGVTAADYHLLQRLDRDYPGRLFFGHNHRFEPAFQNSLAIIRQGLLGTIQVAKLCKHHVFMRRHDWQMRLDCGGGQLSVWGPHLIDQGLQLLGSPVREVHSYLRRVLTPGDADDHVKIIMTGANGMVAEVEISNSMALPGPYAAIYGDRGALVYGQEQKVIELKYLDPDFRWPAASASAVTPVPGNTLNADRELPWIEETRDVVPGVSLWTHVEVEIARHLHAAIREGVPFPVRNADALEVVRITEWVKKQNQEFAWIG